jgi:hypothetical protein
VRSGRPVSSRSIAAFSAASLFGPIASCISLHERRDEAALALVVLQQGLPLKRGEPACAEHPLAFDDRGLPGRQVAECDAGVRAAVRAAMGQRRCTALDRGFFAIQAERGVGIEEAIRQQPDVERAPEMREHRAHSLGVDDPAGKWVSKGDEQSNKAQIKALTDAGCVRTFEEEASGGRWERPELHRMLDQLRDVDTVIVWKLDRLSRSLRDVLTIMERIEATGAGFRSLTEAIDTTTPAGRMMMQIVGLHLNVRMRRFVQVAALNYETLCRANLNFAARMRLDIGSRG